MSNCPIFDKDLTLDLAARSAQYKPYHQVVTAGV